MLQEKQEACGKELADIDEKISSAKPADGEKSDDSETESLRSQRKDILERFADGNTLLHQVTGLALLSNGMLKGKALADFIRNSYEVVGKAFTK